MKLERPTRIADVEAIDGWFSVACNDGWPGEITVGAYAYAPKRDRNGVVLEHLGRFTKIPRARYCIARRLTCDDAETYIEAPTVPQVEIPENGRTARADRPSNPRKRRRAPAPDKRGGRGNVRK